MSERKGGRGREKAFTNPYNLRSRLLGDDETCFATKKNCFFQILFADVHQFHLELQKFNI